MSLAWKILLIMAVFVLASVLVTASSSVPHILLEYVKLNTWVPIFAGISMLVLVFLVATSDRKPRTGKY
jgi:hypothetical protein